MGRDNHRGDAVRHLPFGLLADHMTKLLIDGDEYLFTACVVTETDIRWDEYNHVLQANRNEAWNNFATAIDRLATKFNTQDITLCFSGTYDTPNFRLAIDPSYKAGRAGN